MGSNVNLSTLRASGLEKMLRGNIFSKYYGMMDNYIISNLNNEGENFSLPVVKVFTDENLQLRKELLDLYHSKFPEEYTMDIDEDIKLLQACVLDGMVVGLNFEKGVDYQIYTANLSAIFRMNKNTKFNIEKAIELNRRGIVHAVRIDIEYTSAEGFSYKAVTLNKNTNLDIANSDGSGGRFFIVPYIAITRSMEFFKKLLDSGKVVKVGQDIGELYKERYITSDIDVISRYSDSEAFAKTLRPSYFPLKGFFYAPVLGASSDTLGLTRIDILNVCSVRNAKNINVEKARGGVDELIRRSAVQSRMLDLYIHDISMYMAIIDELPNTEGVLTGYLNDVYSGTIHPSSFMRYYHTLDSNTQNIVDSMIPKLQEEIITKKEVLNRYEELNPSDYSNEEIRNLLKTGVYKFVIRKKDCNYSNVMITNSNELLKKLYGKDYFAHYESTGVRLIHLSSLIKSDLDLTREKVALKLDYCGFPCENAIIDKIMEMVLTPYLNLTLEELLTDKKPGGKRAIHGSSSNDSMILGRKCFAILSDVGSLDFYRNLDMSKVVAMYRVG